MFNCYGPLVSRVTSSLHIVARATESDPGRPDDGDAVGTVRRANAGGGRSRGHPEGWGGMGAAFLRNALRFVDDGRGIAILIAS